MSQANSISKVIDIRLAKIGIDLDNQTKTMMVSFCDYLLPQPVSAVDTVQIKM